MTRKLAIKFACGVIVVVVGIGVLPVITVHTRTVFTCALCRVERTDKSLFGYSWQTFRDTELTVWYQAHRMAHGHIWGRASCTRGRNVFGQTILWSCGPQHPVADLSPQRERQLVEQADPAYLAEFFEGITSTDRQIQMRTVAKAEAKLFDGP